MEMTITVASLIVAAGVWAAFVVYTCAVCYIEYRKAKDKLKNRK